MKHLGSYLERSAGRPYDTPGRYDIHVRNTIATGPCTPYNIRYHR
jgi:hypothetical protein